MPAPSAVIKKAKTRKTPRVVFDQERLEELILRYQAAHESEQYQYANDIYISICEVYEPHKFVYKWFPKYKHLYEDSLDDFQQDYMRVFLNTLLAWKPRHLRGESKHGGKGDFKNYFWGALQHYFINIVKSEASCKRNVTKQCPICEKWCSPLSTHLIAHHPDLLWEHLIECGVEVEILKTCPYCKAYKRPRVVKCEHKEEGADCLRAEEQRRIRKHLLSAHSNMLFERFHMLYPDSITLSSKPVSVNFTDDTEEEASLYDVLPANNLVDNLISQSVSSVQKTLLTRVLNGSMDISYDSNLYKCSQEDFERELDDLRSKMTLCGFEG